MRNPHAAGPGSRRALLRGAGAAAGALLAGPLLAGCGLASELAQVQRSFRPVTLTVYLLGGKQEPQTAAPLTDLLKPLQAAVQQAQKLTSGISQVNFQAGGGDATAWFPLPSTLYNPGGGPLSRADDPSIPMPDVVVCMHSEMPDYLANRALDLDPYVKLHSAVLQGISAQVLRQGRAYSAQRGTIQASLPLLRIPPLCLVPPGTTAVSGGKPWSVDQFVQALQKLAGEYVAPNAPLPYLPESIMAPLAIMGSGGTVAQSSDSAAQAAFASGAAAQGLAELVGWGQYAASQPFFRFGGRAQTVQFGMYIGDGQSTLRTGQPPNFTPFGGGFGRGGGGGAASSSGQSAAAAWQIAPLPAFPTRTVVPMLSNIDVMVFRHTTAPDQAAALAVTLLSSAVQQGLLTYRGGLALRAEQASRQLSTTIGGVQGAEIIASGQNDVIAEDWMGGPETDGNAQGWTLIQQNLSAALDQLMGARDGNFGFGFGGGGPSYPALPSADQIAQVLQQAQQASNQGQSYTGQ